MLNAFIANKKISLEFLFINFMSNLLDWLFVKWVDCVDFTEVLRSLIGSSNRRFVNRLNSA